MKLCRKYMFSTLLFVLATILPLFLWNKLQGVDNLYMYAHAKDMLTKEEFEAPKLWVDPTIKDFYQFTANSFKLENYQYNEFHHEIPIAI